MEFFVYNVIGCQKRCAMESQANGVDCDVVEWVKRSTLRWFGHIERIGSKEFVKKVYMSESVGPNSKGRPPVRWRDRVEEYMCEKGGGLDRARREYSHTPLNEQDRGCQSCS